MHVTAGLKVGSVHFHRDAFHDQVQAQDKSKPVLFPHNDSGHAGERPPQNRRLLSDIQIWVRFNFEMVDASPQRFNLKMRQWDRVFPRPNDGMDSRNPQNLRPGTPVDLHE
jgi:hypothetical protein